MSQLGASERDPWECRGFRVVPCMDGDSVWVEIEAPRQLPVELSPDGVRELAEFLTRVADTAEAWRGGRRRPTTTHATRFTLSLTAG